MIGVRSPFAQNAAKTVADMWGIPAHKRSIAVGQWGTCTSSSIYGLENRHENPELEFM
jgi:hypothetical protein